MVGRVLDRQYPDKQREDERSSDVILSVHGLTERRRFRDISFEVKAGEILGSRGTHRRRTQRDRQGHLPAGG